jgi:hypothetical protein
VDPIGADEYISHVGATIVRDCLGASLLEFDFDDALVRQDFGFVLDILIQDLQNHLAIQK